MSSPAVAPGPDISIASRLVGVTATFYAIAIGAYGLRLYSRIRPVLNLGLDDYAISLALVCALVEWGILMSSVSHGLGRHNFYVSPDEQIQASRLLFISQPPWAWSIAMIKISMACMLLRIKTTKPWKIFLYSMIGLQIATAVAANCAQFLQCRPLAALWDPNTPDVKCWDVKSSQLSIYLNSAIGICTDLTFSFLPISFIRKLERPFWEKVVIASLMGLGLVASVSSIVKTTLISSYGKTGDALWDSVNLSLWSVLEEQIGIIAACIPCLKSPFERMLRRFGVVSIYGNGTVQGRSGYAYYKDESHELGNSRVKTLTAVTRSSSKAGSDENILAIQGARVEEGQIRKTTDFRVTVDSVDKGEA
ncbi:hypothetical protein G7Y89_g9060 [Cudoniella acicularis]|uniref:Rhodopsin domain-containing protein n=1 Tax=Cudoniella acicularis TaxID=354080 RepID=A0A8H4RJ47_9HELO|nr:hypothetical protein G7Y89_g9060 [Cudoniella acicularis]